jgi:hypothetical protein
VLITLVRVGRVGFVEYKVGEKTYFVKELTLGDLRRYLSRVVRRELAVDGSIREYFDTAESLGAILTVCIYVEDSGGKRPLSDREADELPINTALRLVDACLKVNPSLAQGFPTQTQ